MAIVSEKSICHPHAWVGEGACPSCVSARDRERAQYQHMWEHMSHWHKFEELRRRIDELEKKP